MDIIDIKTKDKFQKFKDLERRIQKLEKYYDNIVFEPILKPFEPETKNSIVQVVSFENIKNQNLAIEIAEKYLNVDTWNIFSKTSEIWKNIAKKGNVFDFDQLELERIHNELNSNETKSIGIVFDNVCNHHNFKTSEILQSFIKQIRHLNTVVIFCDTQLTQSSPMNVEFVDYLAFYYVTGKDLKYMYDHCMDNIIIDNKLMHCKLFIRLFQERETEMIFNNKSISKKFEDKFNTMI